MFVGEEETLVFILIYLFLVLGYQRTFLITFFASVIERYKARQ